MGNIGGQEEQIGMHSKSQTNVISQQQQIPQKSNTFWLRYAHDNLHLPKKNNRKHDFLRFFGGFARSLHK